MFFHASGFVPGADQPAHLGLEITTISVARRAVPVAERTVATTPFLRVIEVTRSDAAPAHDVLVVPPLSGQFAIMMRDLVLGLLPSSRVLVIDWTNARYVPADHGPFRFEENIASVTRAMSLLRPGSMAIGVCQGGYLALAAMALRATSSPALAPLALVLIAAPVDPLSHPSGTSTLIQGKSMEWMEGNLIRPVPDRFPGAGRLVYPAATQLSALWSYLLRRVCMGGELLGKVIADDGADPKRFPFLDCYTSIMDLDAAAFLGSLKSIYHDRDLVQGELVAGGVRIELGALDATGIMTIEGQADDVVAPGQTSAVHDLCPARDADRRRLVVPHSGHFSLFHGEVWRRDVLPEVLVFRDGRSAGARA